MQKLYDENSVRNVAKAIRGVTNFADSYTLTAMESAVKEVHHSPAALELAVKTYDMANQVTKPGEPIDESMYTPEMFEEIQNLLTILGGEE